MKSIPYNGQYIDFKDIELVSKSLKKDKITTGKYVDEFEKKISKYVKSKYAVVCNNGTAAIHLAFMSINLKKNDVVIMPAINFVSAFNVASLIGAKIFLSDVDKNTGQMTPKTLLECIKRNRIKKFKAFVTMYLGGYPDNIFEFYKIKKKYKCYFIEDACHAFGASYICKGKYFKVGSCKHSDISTFSFHPVKPITTGEGGALTMNKSSIYEMAKVLRAHGIIRSKNSPWEYDILKPGMNYRLSDINCALGISQIRKIDKFIKKRKIIADSYNNFFSKHKKYINTPTYNKDNTSAYHLFLISLNLKNLKCKKNTLLNFLKKNKINAQYHYIPIYRFNFLKKLKFKKNHFTGSDSFYRKSLSLPIFFNLSDIQLKYIMYKLTKFLNFYKKNVAWKI